MKKLLAALSVTLMLGALFTFSTPKSAAAQGGGVAGVWGLDQVGDNGVRYTGKAFVNANGSGEVTWDNHRPGSLRNLQISGNTVRFTIVYADGLEGYYTATVNLAGNQLFGGRCASNRGTSASFTAARR